MCPAQRHRTLALSLFLILLGCFSALLMVQTSRTSRLEESRVTEAASTVRRLGQALHHYVETNAEYPGTARRNTPAIGTLHLESCTPKSELYG
jgi:hypothetical protein